jgi:hypothetical protein
MQLQYLYLTIVQGQIKKIGTLTGNIAITNTSTSNGSSGIYEITQDATGNRTVTINGSTITVNPTASTPTIISWVFDGVSYSFESNYTPTETASSIKAKLGITTLSGSNTGDETTARINALYGYTPANSTVVASNTASIGTLSSLTTTAKDNLVNAINEVKAYCWNRWRRKH